MSDKQGAPTLPPLAGGGGNNGTSNPGASQQTVSLQQVFASGQGLNVLTTPAGQQFVITSQVPGLTQVISSGSSTNASGLQQVGFQRIVNLTGGSPRVSVVGVASASGSPLSSPNRQTTTKVVLATSPKLVRTSLGNMFITPSSQSASPGQQQQSSSSASASASSPARKKLRLTETTEKITAIDDTTTTGYRRRIMEHKMKRMRAIREKYAENASELFFLHAGGNMMDFQTWKRRQPTPQYLHFLRQHRLDPEDDDEDLTVPLPPISTGNDVVLANVAGSCATTVVLPGNPVIGTNVNTPVTLSGEVKITGIGGTPVAVSTTLPAAVAQLSQQGGTPLVTEASKPQPPPPPTTPIAPAITMMTTTTMATTTTTTTTTTTPLVCPTVEKSIITTSTATLLSSSKSTAIASTTSTVVTCCVSSVSSPQPIVKLVKLPSSTITSSATTATTMNSSLVTAATSETQNNQEQIVEKAKQEAYVMQRIAELQRDGLWPERRLPKVQEPARAKAHWDYLLEEMVWLAADFAQERKWKKAAAKKCARMVQKHFQEKAIQAQKAEKSHELRLKKIAGFAAKEIKTFWTNVEKLVEFKQQTRLEEKRKKALDQHLNFIVGQTEKYSTWLTEGLNKTDGAQSVPASINSSRISSPVPTNKQHSDDEFEPNQSSEDDEETIAKAEEEMKSTTNHKEEVELLKKESELPLEDLLKELPPNYLEERDKSLSPVMKEIVENENDATADGDTEFTVASEESSDDENTIMEQEKLEGNANHQKELDELKAENDMTIDELMEKYGNMPATPMDVDGDTDRESVDDSDKEDAEKNEEKSDSESESEDETKAADEEEDSPTQSDDETGVGLKSLLEDLSTEKPEDNNKTAISEQCDNHNEMDDVAALAESIQPKGNTLLTTSVVTKIPFLLKHSLREYQHIGLDWLTTMYERKLNGILADEMGLGKTIQTIALLAHLACEKGNWGPHLIIVPTSVMLNWEMECKKWCPGFKILTYYGTQKERKQKRTGWTKPNAFHICITSYKLVIQDHQSFRRKKWKYLILDEAQNIKNFKSQRWQLLLNFQTQRRLLLTGTPLQNNLMELWSLMHFLMPNVFQSHREFKEWFSNPVTGMIEGNSEYNENIIRRLHKVLRPFLLRRLKTEVEKQLPKKYEHVVMCRLSKRQRYLYDDFMSRAKTKETLASGNLLSVINVLMQLRKVCNHPNLFEVRPTVSPFQMEAIEFVTASLAWSALDYHPFKSIDLSCLNLYLVDLELTLTAFVAHRVKRLQTPRKLIEEIDSVPDVAPRCPSGKIKINVRLSNQTKSPAAPPPPPPTTTAVVQTKMKNLTGIVQNPRVGTSPLIKSLNNQSTPGQGVTLRVATGQHLQGYSVQLVQHQGSVKAIPVATLAHNSPGVQNVTTTSSAGMNAQRITMGNTNIRDGLQRLTTQTVTVKQGDSLQRIAVPSFAQLVQTSTGRHIILTSNQQNTNTVSFPVMAGGQRLTVLSKSIMGLSTANKVVGSVVTTTTNAGGRVGMRVPPLNVNASPGQNLAALQPQQQAQQPQQLRCGIVTRTTQKEAIKTQIKEQPKSEFYLPQLEEERRQRRQSKLRTIANINERRCAACPLYGEDLFTALRIGKPATGCQWHNGPTNCSGAKETPRTRRQFFSRTEALAAAIKSTEQIVEELKEVFQRFVVYVPAVRAPAPRFHVSHPPPHKIWSQQRLRNEIERELTPKLSILHPIAGAMMTQFPDPRLIQYDCGKLQSLDRLLRKLKTGSHRVLIFTQMTRMLDVLEAFLNFHGHIYLRLDGATKVDQRQVLMERFNGDKRIFCFILSTRSGGVGVNLTGADTVIFYDSDWNPTMDAQAQDRCHRIGQTRDVHIYRLVSEKTVEENILKKANQKRLLGDLAIEGGNFTTAYFKSSTIQDLFNVDQSENDASARMADVLDQSKERERALHRELTTSTITTPAASTSAQPNEEKVAIGALESALAAAEEDLDVQAAKTAKAEAVADLAEFDENIPLDDADKEDNAQVSKAEQEVQHLVSQLTPVERYAMKFVEESEGTFSAAQLAAAERELEQQKKEWELDRLRALREEEERRLRLADDDEKPLTFGREDSQNQVNNTSSSSKRLSIKKRASQENSSTNNVTTTMTMTRRTSLRRASNRSARDESISESETETTTDTDDESESHDDDLVEDSPDEESSHTESQSQGDDEEDDDDDENGDADDDEDYENDDEEIRETRADNERNNAARGNVGYSKRRNRSNKSSERNSRWDLNSPRTRSRGNVKINLWTLDVSPILPGVKPNFRNRRTAQKRGRRKKSERKKSDAALFALPISPSPKRGINNANSNEKTKCYSDEKTRDESAEKLLKKNANLSNSGNDKKIEVSVKSKEEKIAEKISRKNSNLNNSGNEKKIEFSEKSSRKNSSFSVVSGVEKIPEKLRKKNTSLNNIVVETKLEGLEKRKKIVNSTNSENRDKLLRNNANLSSNEEKHSSEDNDDSTNSRESSPVDTKMSNVEILMDEKMSEISCSMELALQSDESVEHERSCAFSPDAKTRVDEEPFDVSSLMSSAAPRLEIILSDIAAVQKIDEKNNEKKSLNQSESVKPRGTRSKPSNVKRLTQTFDASFDESGVSSNYEIESVTSENLPSNKPIHVTRSSHRVTTNFGSNSEETDSLEDNDEIMRKELASEIPEVTSDSKKDTDEERVAFLQPEVPPILLREESETNSRQSPSRRSSIKRITSKSTTPEPEKNFCVDSINEMIGLSTQRRRSVATRSRNKIQLDEITKIIETVNQEKILTDSSRNYEKTSESEDVAEAPILAPEISKNVKQELINDFSDEKILEPSDKNYDSPIEPATSRSDDKISEKNNKNDEKCSFPVSKLSLETRVRLRRPDTPFPGVLTRRAKTTVLEASTSATTASGSSSSSSSSGSSSSEADAKFAVPRAFRKSLDGRRSARLNTVSESQDGEQSSRSLLKTSTRILTQKQSDIVITDSARLILTRSNSVTSSSSPPPLAALQNPQNCTITLKPLQKKCLESTSDAIGEASSSSSSSSPSSRPKTRSSLSVGENSLKIISSPAERPTTRSARASLDNGNFVLPQTSQNFRKNRVVDASRLTRKFMPMVDNVSVLNSPQKKRPDTPLPVSQDNTTRVTRSGVDFAVTSGSRLRNIRRISLSNEDATEKRENLDTDTNGNALGHETYSKDNSDETSIESGNERPQRTAKVVAILTLDSLSRGYKSNATSTGCARRNDETEEKIISVVDLESGESENESAQETNQRRTMARRSVKRTRIGGAMTKPIATRDANEIQVVEINDDDDTQTQPTRKIVKLQNSTTIDRFNSSAS